MTVSVDKHGTTVVTCMLLVACCSPAPEGKEQGPAVRPAVTPVAPLDHRTDVTVQEWPSLVPHGRSEAASALYVNGVLVWKGTVAKPEKDAPQPTATILRLLDPLPTSGRIEIRIDVDAVSNRKEVPVEVDRFLHVVCLGEASGINVAWMTQPGAF